MRLSILLGACLSALMAGCGGSPLPPPSSVLQMKMDFDDIDMKIRSSFDIPEDHWEKIMNAIHPAAQDNQPAKWEGLGELTIITSSAQIKVSLYQTRREVGAFAIGDHWRSRVYYRGGNTNQLLRVLRSARDVAKGR